MNTQVNIQTERKQFISGLKDYIENCQKDVTDVLQRLNWSPEHFLQAKSTSKCKHDNGHVMPCEVLEKHEKVCPFHQRGLSKQEAEDAAGSNKFFYENSTTVKSVDIDKDELNKVLWDHHVKNHSIFYGQKELPTSLEEEKCKLIPEERAAVHSHLIEKVKDESQVQSKVDEFLTTDLQNIVMNQATGGDAPKSYLEYIQAQRDYKRRRQTYRAKNVHITKKSYTEIIREVITNQTELFASFLHQEEEDHPKHKRQRSPNKEQASSRQYDSPSRVHRDRSADQLKYSSSSTHERSASKGRDDCDYSSEKRDYSSDSDCESGKKKKKKSHKKHKHKHSSKHHKHK